MKNQYFTTKQDLFTITFHGSNLTVIINGGEPESLGNAIQKFNQYGIKKYAVLILQTLSLRKSQKKRLKTFLIATHTV
jgi:hypothetical protein